MSILLDGTLGITTPGLTNTGTETLVNLTTTGNTILGDASTDTLNVGNGGLIKDASGNVGVGVTPSAWGGSFKALQIGLGTSLYNNASGNGTFLGSNFYWDGTNNKYLNTNTATAYGQSAGAHQWYTAASGTAGNAITFTQAMTLDASGNLGVGVTNPQAKLHVLDTAGTTVGTIRLGDASTYYGTIQHEAAVTGAMIYTVASASGGGHIWKRGSTEFGRFDLNGNLLVGTTSNPNSCKIAIGPTASNGISIESNSTSVVMSQLLFRNPNGIVGSVSTAGSTTTYATSSDYRLKNTIAPMTGALGKVALLKPVTYKWNADGSDSQGFIAHELAEVCPQAVVGEKDAVDENGNPKYQGIDTSFLVATLTAAIQEQQAIIQTLTDRITALENK